jgi:hypothetical protein
MVLSYHFDPCSNRHSYSLASICPYTPLWIHLQMNLPYAHIRYHLEGYRPSQTNKVTQSVFLPLSSLNFVSGIHCQSGISLLLGFLRSPTYPTQLNGHTQCNPSVKVYGVFSSTSQLTVSSLLFQFHLDERRDSTGVVIALDHDHN